jgi:hypothetical protein
MKQENPKNEDPQLSRLLKTWRVNEPLPPRFQVSVWKRIETAESGRGKFTAPGVLDWMTALFARPAFATVCAAILLIAGLTTGFVRAEHDAGRMNSELAQRYVTSVDPYANQDH